MVSRAAAQFLPTGVAAPRFAPQSADPCEPEMAETSFNDEVLDGGGHVIAVTGELDLTSVGDLRRRVDAALASGRPRVVVDLTGATHLDSSALAELLSAHQRAIGLRGGLALVVTTPAIRRILEIRGVDGLFTIAATRSEAHAALA
jgi:anti-sigma B factor antagonist